MPTGPIGQSSRKGPVRRTRSAIWVRQDKPTIRRIQTEKGVFKWKRSLADYFVYSSRPASEFSIVEKRGFIRRNKEWLLADLIHEGLWEKGRRFTDIHVSAIPTRQIDKSLNRTLKGGRASIVSLFARAVEHTFRSYAAARKIPFHAAVVESIMGELLVDAIRSGGALSMREVEAKYLAESKRIRKVYHQNQVRVNGLVGLLIGRRRFTPNQKRSIKQWIVRNLADLRQEIQDILIRQGTDFSPEAYNRVAAEVQKIYFERAEREVIRTFQSAPKIRKLPTVPAGSSGQKSGSRTERMAAYQREPGETTPAERREQIKSRTDVANQRGEAFSSTAYIIHEIRKRNPESANLLDRLVRERVITPNAVDRLYIAGNLAQRTFYEVLTTSDFVDRFSTAKIPILLSWIAMVGDRGVEKGRAHKAFNDKEGEKMFQFLDNNDFLEHHTGNTAIYLRRPQTKKKGYQ